MEIAVMTLKKSKMVDVKILNKFRTSIVKGSVLFKSFLDFCTIHFRLSMPVEQISCWLFFFKQNTPGINY